jgi:hypothetical protein
MVCMREIGIHAVRDKKKLPSAMDSDAGEACGGKIEVMRVQEENAKTTRMKSVRMSRNL